MHRVNQILKQLNVSPCNNNNNNNNNDEVTETSSLDVFEIMNAVLNGGRGGGINEMALRDDDKLRRVFEKMDLNNSGDLDRNEFAKAARLCSMVVTEDEIDRIYAKMAGRRGTITFDQFKVAISSLVDSFQVSSKDFTNLSNDKRTVIALWDQYMNGNKQASDLFTSKLLRDQSLKGLKNVDLDRQASMVFGMVSNAIRGLVDEERLLQRLEKEGTRHYYTFNLTDKQYDAVRTALFETLPTIMGKDYNFYAQMQFEKYWDLIQAAMVKGFQSR